MRTDISIMRLIIVAFSIIFGISIAIIVSCYFALSSRIHWLPLRRMILSARASELSVTESIAIDINIKYLTRALMGNRLQKYAIHSVDMDGSFDNNLRIPEWYTHSIIMRVMAILYIFLPGSKIETYRKCMPLDDGNSILTQTLRLSGIVAAIARRWAVNDIRRGIIDSNMAVKEALENPLHFTRNEPLR